MIALRYKLRDKCLPTFMKKSKICLKSTLRPSFNFSNYMKTFNYIRKIFNLKGKSMGRIITLR